MSSQFLLSTDFWLLAKENWEQATLVEESFSWLARPPSENSWLARPPSENDLGGGLPSENESPGSVLASRNEVTMASTLVSPVIKRSLLNSDSASLVVPFL